MAKKNYKILSDIWRDSPGKLRDIDSSYNRQQCLDLLDRPAIWTQLGVLVDGIFVEETQEWEHYYRIRRMQT